jgi:hypothetical protein
MKYQIVLILLFIVIATGLLNYQMYYDYFIDYNDNTIDYYMYPTYSLNTDNGKQNSFSIFQTDMYSNQNVAATPSNLCQTDPSIPCKNFCDKSVLKANDLCVKPSTTTPPPPSKCEPNIYGGWVFNANKLFRRSCFTETSQFL